MKASYRRRRFYIVCALFILSLSLSIFTGYVVIYAQGALSEWMSFMIVSFPMLIGTIGAWLGIETGKLRGGRND